MFESNTRVPHVLPSRANNFVLFSHLHFLAVFAVKLRPVVIMVTFQVVLLRPLPICFILDTHISKVCVVSPFPFTSHTFSRLCPPPLGGSLSSGIRNEKQHPAPWLMGANPARNHGRDLCGPLLTGGKPTQAQLAG